MTAECGAHCRFHAPANADRNPDRLSLSLPLFHHFTTMTLFFMTLCRTSGAYAAPATPLLQLFPRDGQGPGAAMLMLALLAVFYWQCRNRRWWQLGSGLSAFVLMLDWLMRQDRGSMGQTFFSAAALFGMVYLPLIALWEGNRRLARKIAGDAGCDAALRASEWLLLALLSVPVHLLLFIVVNALDVLDAHALRHGGAVMNCLFSFAQPVNLLAYRDALNMLVAAVPVLLLATMLVAWLRRCRGHQLTMPWQLYFAAVPGVLCGGLLLASMLMR